MIVASGGIGDNILLSRILCKFLYFSKENEDVVLLLRDDSRCVSFLFSNDVDVEFYNWKKFRRSILYRMMLYIRMRQKNLRLVISTDYERHPKVDELIIASCACEAWGEKARYSHKHEKLLLKNEKIFTRLAENGTNAYRFMHWVSLAEKLGHPKIALSDIAIGGAKNGGKKNRIIYIHPFSNDLRREISSNKFLEIIQSIPSTYEIRLSGSPGQVEERSEWLEIVDESGIIIDDSSLAQKFETFKDVCLVITVDTSILHLSAVAGAKTICICGDAYRGWSAPYDSEFCPNNVTFYSFRCEYGGCLGACRFPLENGLFRCNNMVSISDVIFYLRNLN